MTSRPDQQQLIEEQFDNNDYRRMWKGVKALTDYKTSNPPPNADTALPGPHQVRVTVKKTNARKTAGPDGVTGQMLKDCAEQLTEIFTNIFNLSVTKRSSIKCLNDCSRCLVTLTR